MTTFLSGYQTVGNVVSNAASYIAMYTAKLEHDALPRMRFYDFAAKMDDLTKGKGDRIIFTAFGDLLGGGMLSESVRMVEEPMTAAQYGITVTEYGHAVALTQKGQTLSIHDLKGESLLLLTRNYARRLDDILRAAALKTSNVVFPSEDIQTRAALRGKVDYFNVDAVNYALEMLRINAAPMFMDPMLGEYYVCMAHPHQTAGLQKDPSFKAVDMYRGSAAKVFIGELGMYNGVRFIDSTLMPNGVASAKWGLSTDLTSAATGGAAPADVYQAVVFGENAYGLARALPVEMRVKLAEDYGRESGVAWYSIMGADLLKEDYAVRIETV